MEHTIQWIQCGKGNEIISMKNYLFYSARMGYTTSCFFSPSECYPEYPFKTESEAISIDNTVYSGVRSVFLYTGLDENHYGQSIWNPLGEYIQPGQNVLIKPNFVMHKNGSSNPHEMESLVTHASVIRAVIDYCLIALKGKGNLVIADSPVKDCNFSLLMENAGYDKLVDFYRHVNAKPMPIFYDLRGPEEEGGKYYQAGKGVLVDLGKDSFFYNSGYDPEKLRIPNYDHRKVSNHHCGKKQEYMINSIVLNADVIISLPKPKTHRKNGYTGALKNTVGISYSKEYLPHHTAGDILSGGDEYKKSNQYRSKQSKLRDRIDINRTQIDQLNRKIEGCQTHCSRLFLRAIRKNKNRILQKRWRNWKKFSRQDDEYTKAFSVTPEDIAKEGAWHGNDTLWRAVLDLNLIVQYADRNGIMHDKPQRKILYLGDMVTSGEGEGPMSPVSKEMHTLLFSDNPVVFDAILVKMMGFDWRKFRVLENAMKRSALFNGKYNDIFVNSNVVEYNDKLANLTFQGYTPFEPAMGWKGFIELK